MNTFKTEQENFWHGDFGTNYIDRNNETEIVAANVNFFSSILNNTSKVEKIIEFGSNIGMNLKALKTLLPKTELSAIEINPTAAASLRDWSAVKNVYEMSILDFKPDYQRDFVLIKGVLIHINPEQLNTVYEALYNTSCKYICIAEYYNPTPVEVNYRGHSERLFKRDFAGEMLDKYKDLKLVNYGFTYRRDNVFEHDDLTWFLLEKVQQN